jgi:hypothetical protein
MPNIKGVRFDAYGVPIQSKKKSRVTSLGDTAKQEWKQTCFVMGMQ